MNLMKYIGVKVVQPNGCSKVGWVKLERLWTNQRPLLDTPFRTDRKRSRGSTRADSFPVSGLHVQDPYDLLVHHFPARIMARIVEIDPVIAVRISVEVEGSVSRLLGE